MQAVAAAVWSYLGHPLAPSTLASFLFVIAAAAYISWVIVYSGVNKPNRLWLKESEMMADAHGHATLAKVLGKVYDMTQCPFCTGMWVSTAIMLVFRFDWVGAGPLGVLLGIPAVAGLQAALALSLGLLVKKNPCDSCVTVEQVEMVPQAEAEMVEHHEQHEPQAAPALQPA